MKEKVTNWKDAICYSSSLSDDSITCGEISDEASSDSCSECSRTIERPDEIAIPKDFQHVNDEEEIKCEIESHAANMIQNACCQWMKKEKVRKQVETELLASQILMNAYRTWSMKQKVMKEVNAAQTIQCAWSSWMNTERRRQTTKKEINAVTTIQSKWRNYHVKLSRTKVLEDEEAELTRCQNIAFSTGVLVFSHLLLHTYFWQ